MILLKISLAEPKAKSKKMSPTDLVEEEEKAKVEAEPRSEKEEENLGKVLPKDINNTHLLLCSAAILDDLPDKMGDPGVPTISCLIGVDVSYASPQAHEIVNVTLHRKYSLGIVFIFSQWRKDLYHI
jgi:hypothetical protein